MASIDPLRGEIWWVDLEPTRGSELRKRRPGLVVSLDGISTLPVRMVAPITDWNDGFNRQSWHIRLDPTSENGLAKTSCVDVLQLRCLDITRFAGRLGVIADDEMRDIAAMIAILVGYV